MTKYIHPEETLNIYYRTTKDGIQDIVTIEDEEDNDVTSALDNLQNVQMIQWSPNENDHLNKIYELNIANSNTQKVKVTKISDRNLINAWIYNNQDSTVEDIIGDANKTLNGIDFVEGDWIGGYAGSSDGENDYAIIDADKIDNGLWRGSSHTHAFSFETKDSNGVLFGVGEEKVSGGTTQFCLINIEENGEIRYLLRDENEGVLNIKTKNSYNDGNKHSIVIQVPNPEDGNSVRITIDGKEVETELSLNDFDSDAIIPYSVDFCFFARNSRGDIDNYIKTKIGDIHLVDTDWTNNETSAYHNSQPFNN